MFGADKKVDDGGMVLNVFAVYDKKAQAYFFPSYFTYKGEALRAFEDQANAGGSPISKHRADYALYRLGSFNTKTGELVSCLKPEFVAEALDFAPAKENV